MPVVVVDNLLSVIHATVANLDGIVAEDISKLVIFREVFVYQGDGFMIDISVDIFAEWRVVPKDVSLSVSSFSSCDRFVVESVVVSAFVECFLVWRGGLVK